MGSWRNARAASASDAGTPTQSTTRTSEQMNAVKFWTQINIGAGWQAARQYAMAKSLSLADNARFFALLNQKL